MKKLLRFADCFVLLAAIIGCLLHLWFENAGVDNKGLHITSHPAWVLLCIISVAIVVVNWLLSREAGGEQSYEKNFPRSYVGAATLILMAGILGYQGITMLLDGSSLRDWLTAIACMGSAVCMGVAGVDRFSGYKSVFFVYLVPCVYATLRVFQMGSAFGSDPTISSFLFRFLASLSMIPAFFWLWAFQTNQSRRQRSLFWSLTAAYLCLVTTFEAPSEWLFYLAMAAVLLSNLCYLGHLPGQTEAVAPEADPARPRQTPTETTPFVPDADVQKIMEEILNKVSQQLQEEAPAEEIPEAPVPVVEEPPVAAFQEALAPTAFPLANLASIRKRPVLHADIDPETDMDAFLKDIRQFLSSDSE